MSDRFGERRVSLKEAPRSLDRAVWASMSNVICACSKKDKPYNTLIGRSSVSPNMIWWFLPSVVKGRYIVISTSMMYTMTPPCVFLNILQELLLQSQHVRFPGHGASSSCVCESPEIILSVSSFRNYMANRNVNEWERIADWESKTSETIGRRNEW